MKQIARTVFGSGKLDGLSIEKSNNALYLAVEPTVIVDVALLGDMTTAEGDLIVFYSSEKVKLGISAIGGSYIDTCRVGRIIRGMHVLRSIVAKDDDACMITKAGVH